jgi:phospholipid/cholesterol/gamma-HCH transport system substrate-binding protein
MKAKREQTLVGLLVIVATGILIATVFALSGAFAGSSNTYRAYFPFAGGIEPGATVRYAGGPKVGRVEHIAIDPQNPARIEITFSVRPDIPVKQDSKVRIMSMSPLGDNHVEIVAGSPESPKAVSGMVLTSVPYLDFNVLTSQINNIAPEAQRLLSTLNQRASELQVTVARVNDLLSDKNRANISATIANTRGLIEEDRPVLKATLEHVDGATQKLAPLIDNFRKTSEQANKTLDHVDALIGENRPDIHQALVQLRQSLASVQDLTDQLNSTLDANSENIDELLDNLRHVTENLDQFTETIKRRPYTLIRASSPKEHKPGEP